MAENAWFEKFSATQQCVDIQGQFAPNGAVAIDQTTVKGKGFTILRTGVGLYRVTFNGRYAQLLDWSVSFALSVLAVRVGIAKTITIGTTVLNTVDIQVIDGAGAAVEIAANVANLISFRFTLLNTVNPSL